MYAIVLIFGQSEQVWIRETEHGARELYEQIMKEYNMKPAIGDPMESQEDPWSFCNTHCWGETDDKTMLLTKVAV